MAINVFQDPGCPSRERERERERERAVILKDTPMLWDNSFVCCEYVSFPLVNKLNALAYTKAGYSQVGNPRRDTQRRREESGQMPASCRSNKMY